MASHHIPSKCDEDKKDPPLLQGRDRETSISCENWHRWHTLADCSSCWIGKDPCAPKKEKENLRSCENEVGLIGDHDGIIDVRCCVIRYILPFELLFSFPRACLRGHIKIEDVVQYGKVILLPW
jgi:hypothetical protein